MELEQTDAEPDFLQASTCTIHAHQGTFIVLVVRWTFCVEFVRRFWLLEFFLMLRNLSQNRRRYLPLKLLSNLSMFLLVLIRNQALFLEQLCRERRENRLAISTNRMELT